MPGNLLRVGLALLLAAASCLGCQKPETPTTKDGLPVKATARKAREPERAHESKSVRSTQLSSPPVSLSECYQFAFDLDKAMKAGDVEAVNALMNWNAMLDVSAAGQAVPAEVRARYVAQHSREVAEDEALVSIRKGAQYTAIRIHFDQGSAAVWFRLQHTNGALFFHEYRLGRGVDGKVQACDIYRSGSGDTAGESLRPLYSTMLKYQAQGSTVGFTTLEQAIVKHHDDIKNIYRCSQRGDHAGVIALYHQFPAEVQRLRCVLISRYEAAIKVSKEETLLALRDAERFYRDEGSLESLLSDYYYGQGKWRDALACIDRLNWRVGGDVQLSAQRVTVLIQAGELEQASREASLLVLWAPNTSTGYRVALSVARVTKDFDRMLSLLKLAESCGLGVIDLAAEPDYTEFVGSPQYAEWLRAHEIADSEPWPRKAF